MCHRATTSGEKLEAGRLCCRRPARKKKRFGEKTPQGRSAGPQEAAAPPLEPPRPCRPQPRCPGPAAPTRSPARGAPSLLPKGPDGTGRDGGSAALPALLGKGRPATWPGSRREADDPTKLLPRSRCLRREGPLAGGSRGGRRSRDGPCPGGCSVPGGQRGPSPGRIGPAGPHSPRAQRCAPAPCPSSLGRQVRRGLQSLTKSNTRNTAEHAPKLDAESAAVFLLDSMSRVRTESGSGPK